MVKETMKGAKRKANSLMKQFMSSAVTVIAKKIVTEKGNDDGRVPWGFASKLLKQGKETFPKMSMRTINNYVLKIELGKERVKMKRVILVDNSTCTLSTLTSSVRQNSDSAPINESSHGSGALLNSMYKDDHSNQLATTDAVTINDTIEKGMGRRPMAAHSLDLKQRINAATADVAETLGKLQRKVKTNAKGRMQKGALADIIYECRVRHNLGPDIEINEDTVRQRVKRNSITGILGPKSPLLLIEPYVVSLIIQLANMHVPITSSQGLQLCNSILKVTIMEYKKNNRRSMPINLGPGYWRGFMKHNKDLISAKKAVKFDTKRAEWCT
jgi:hypothetical protein